MALFENTVIDLVQQMGRLLFKANEYFEGVVDSGSTSTILDDEREEAEDFFQNTAPVSRFYITTTTDGAAPVGEERTITNWAHSTGTGTISADKLFTVTPEADDTYVILNEYRWAEIKAALNMAIDHGTSEGLLAERIDETVNLVAAVYEYPLPVGFTHLYRVTMPNADGDYLNPIPPDQYRILRGRAVPTLRLSTFPVWMEHEGHYYGTLWADNSLVAGRTLRIEGLQKQAKLVNDTDLCYINPEYMIYQAMYYMHSARIRSADQDEHGAQAQICQTTAARALTRSKPPMPPNVKRVET